jgi:hypothetical protein
MFGMKFGRDSWFHFLGFFIEAQGHFGHFIANFNESAPFKSSHQCHMPKFMTHQLKSQAGDLF